MAPAISRNSRFLDGGFWKIHLALVLTQLSVAGYFVLTKAALTDGIDRFVFAVYRNLLGFVLVASFGYFLEKDERTRLTPYVLALLVLAGITGIYANQVLFLTGLALTSPGYAAALQIATPMFTFLIAVLFKTEDIKIRKRNGKAKLLGVLCALVGACLMTFYQGPVVLGSELPELLNGSQDKLALHTPAFLGSVLKRYGITAWQYGSACLVLNTLCLGIFVNLQAPILARYPAPLSETAITMFFGCIFLLGTGLTVVQDTSAWIVTNALGIVSIVYAGAMVSGFTFALSTWCFQRGGPFLVGAYMPLQPVVSGAFGLLFLGDVIYLGSVLGALVVFMGLYLITWGKMESKKELSRIPLQAVVEPSLAQSDIKQPLLNGDHR